MLLLLHHVIAGHVGPCGSGTSAVPAEQTAALHPAAMSCALKELSVLLWLNWMVFSGQGCGSDKEKK